MIALLLCKFQALLVRSAGSIDAKTISSEHIARVKSSFDLNQFIVLLPVEKIEDYEFHIILFSPGVKVLVPDSIQDVAMVRVC